MNQLVELRKVLSHEVAPVMGGRKVLLEHCNALWVDLPADVKTGLADGLFHGLGCRSNAVEDAQENDLIT